MLQDTSGCISWHSSRLLRVRLALGLNHLVSNVIPGNDETNRDSMLRNTTERPNDSWKGVVEVQLWSFPLSRRTM